MWSFSNLKNTLKYFSFIVSVTNIDNRLWFMQPMTVIYLTRGSMPVNHVSVWDGEWSVKVEVS